MKHFLPLKDIWSIIKPYFTQSDERKLSLLMLAGVIVFDVFLVFINVKFAEWNNDFYNALDHKDWEAFKHLLWVFAVIAFGAIFTSVISFYVNQRLQIRWRRWLTHYFLQHWTEDATYFGLKYVNGSSDNPDQRISEDIKDFISHTLNLSLGILSAVITLLSFTGMLWGLSGTFEFNVGGTDMTIYGYMVWFAIFYAFMGSWVTHKIAYPLTELFYKQELREADFRFSMMRLREYSESIAFFRGEKFELKKFHLYFKRLMDNFLSLINMQVRLVTWRVCYNQFSIIFPILVAAPRYFSGAIPLGGLMQTAVAFGKVENSLSWFIENYATLADYRAVTERLKGLHDAMQRWDHYMAERQFAYLRDKRRLEWKSLSIALPTGETILQNANLAFDFGKRYLMTGRTGSGKSTILRTMAGIWPFGTGQMTLPEGEDMFFIPQQSYMPQGTLEDCLIYPLDRSLTEGEREKARTLLDAFRLSKIRDQLDVEEEWGRVLSGGEKQKIAFIRAILRQPTMLVMDEATSAMDAESDADLHRLLKEYLPETTIISVSHRHQVIGEFYDAHYHLEEGELKHVEA